VFCEGIETAALKMSGGGAISLNSTAIAVKPPFPSVELLQGLTTRGFANVLQHKLALRYLL